MECLKSLSTADKENADFAHVGHWIVGSVGSNYTNVLFPDHWLVWVNIGLLTSMASSIVSAIGAFLLTRRSRLLNVGISLEDQAIYQFHRSTRHTLDSIHVATKILPSLLIFATLNFLLAIITWEICTSGLIVLCWPLIFLFLFFVILPLLGKLFTKTKEAFQGRFISQCIRQARRDHEDIARRKMYEVVLASICRDVIHFTPHRRIITALRIARSSDFDTQETNSHWSEIFSAVRRRFDRKTQPSHYSDEDIALLEQILQSYLLNRPSPIHQAFLPYFHHLPTDNVVSNDAIPAIVHTLLDERSKDSIPPTYEATAALGSAEREQEDNIDARNGSNSDQRDRKSVV